MRFRIRAKMAGMAFSDFFALAVACIFGVLAMYLADNGFARTHQWLIPLLWSGCGISVLLAIFRTRWFRTLFVSQEAVSQEATKQEIRDSPFTGDVRMAGRDYHEAPKVPTVKEGTLWYDQGQPSYEIYKETPASHGPGNPIPIRPPAGIRISHAYGLDVSGNDIDVGQTGLSSIDAEHMHGGRISDNKVRSSPISPTTPILRVRGLGGGFLASPEPRLFIQTVAVDNVQTLAANTAINVAAELLFNHPTLGKRKVIPFAWYPAQIGDQPLMHKSGPADIAGGERFNVPYVYKQPRRDRVSFPSERDSSVYREFDEGLWKVLVTVSGDNCASVQCGIAFEVKRDGSLGRQRITTDYSGDFRQWLVTYGSEFGD